jgi:outer membrane protein OmpA-like peptidoglycan-associated protein
MKITLPALLTLLFILFMLTVRWLYTAQIKQKPAYAQAEPTQLPIRLKNLSLGDIDTLLFKGADQFIFPPNDNMPSLNVNNEQSLTRIKDYLLAHPKKKMLITGYYCPDEQAIQPGYFENLGLGRGATIRNLLAAQGIAPERIALDGVLSTTHCKTQPIGFAFFTEAEAIERAPTYYLLNDMTLSGANFSSNGQQFVPGQAFQRYAIAIKNYFATHPESVLYIVGHSSGGADDAALYAQGMQMAQQAMAYFLQLGLPRERLRCVSEGKKHPVATNNTAEGRKKNQRVNFILE